MREEQQTSLGGGRPFIVATDGQQCIELWTVVIAVQTKAHQQQLFVGLSLSGVKNGQLGHGAILHPRGPNPFLNSKTQLLVEFGVHITG
jgi:hypothetical protein